ncbi:zinc finger protein 423-like [Diabrotica virgifera virgifera]|uniref:Zinc finger protein 423-like n=1 Tax=Diabrotica virgifera virgifera TaxID=50390 RepID=A0A6P7EZI5_DIAVI|nr:zinc finger protein 423-like [Diabrotica virgifera virgifera]
MEDHNKTKHPKIKCKLCDADYVSNDVKLMQLHIKAKHCMKCAFCDKSFISMDDLNFHHRYEHLTVECYFCGSYFMSKEEIDQHVKVEHCFQCPGCSESFKSIELRNFHDKNVHLTIKCSHCGILFRKDEHLQQHIEDQHKFVCEWCKKPFNSSEEKNFHQGCIYVTLDCSHCTLYFPTDKQRDEHFEKHHSLLKE